MASFAWLALLRTWGHPTRNMGPWLKGLALGFGAGTLTMGLVSLVSPPREERASEQRAVEKSRRPTVARVQGLLAQGEAGETPVPELLDPLPPSEALAEGAARSRRAEELSAIHAVRDALLAKDPQSALAQLNRYERAYPEASFGLPAQLLRIQALAVSGRPQAARELAAAFVAAHPDSLHAARLRAFTAGETLPE